VLFLTAGVDVQKDRIEVEVVGWGRGKESWSVDYQVLEGQTAEAAVWMKLLGVLNAYYPSASGVNFPIFRYAIDSGYATGEAYTFVRRYGGDRAVVIKGDSRASAPISQPSPVDVGPQGKNVKFGVRVWPVNGSMAAAGSVDRGERRAVSAGLLSFSEVQRGILQADHRWAVGDQGGEGIPADGVAEDEG
jgi:phage terminase large subunit GpA-like protein